MNHSEIAVTTRRRPVRTFSFVVAAGLVLVYVAVCLWMKINEHRLVFRSTSPAVAIKASYGLSSSLVEVGNSAGIALFALRVAAQPQDLDANRWVLFFHGNFGNVTTWWNQREYYRLKALGLNILAPEYPGFGGRPGTSTEPIVEAEAMLAFEYLRTRLHVPADHIVIWGESLGTGPAVDLASHVSAAALVLVAPFTSAVANGARRYPFLPVSLLASDRFESDKKIGRVTAPVFISHTREDAIVPFEEGRQLYALAHDPKAFDEGHGDHAYHDLSFFLHLQRFLSESSGLALHAPKPPVRGPIEAAVNASGGVQAVALYHRLRAESADSMDFGSYNLEDLGFDLLGKKRVDDALAIFKLNVEQFPSAFDTHESLGEALSSAGNRVAALAEFKRSVDLYPGPDNYSHIRVTELTATTGH
jgi:uncharacterized protein